MPIFYTNTGSLGSMQVSGSSIISASAENLVRIIGSGSSILAVSGTRGGILGVSDFNNNTSELLTFSSGSIKIFSIDRLKTVSISGSLVVTGSITGSLLGTASYALSSLTASFALNAGGSTATGDKISSGSVSASVNVGNADTFRIISASSTFVYVSASGNVGIGTTTPNATFNIVTPPADTTGKSFIFKGSNSKEFVSIDKLGFISTVASDTNGANIHFYDNSNTKRAELSINSTDINWYSDALASNFLVFKHSTGNIGINETSPSGKLEVYDNPTFSTIDTFPQFSIKSATGATGNRLNLGVDQTSGLSFIQSVNRGTGATSLILQRYAGNVGIGGDGVGGFKLHVSGTVNTLNSYYSNGVELITSDGSNNYLKTGASLYIQQGVTTRAFIDGAGNVGIGTTSPASSLDVNGTISLSRANFARLSGNYIQLYTSGSTNIGLYLGGTGDPGNYYDNTNHYFRDIGGSSTYMHITNAANVGINKTNPNAKLDVNGDSFITGSLSVTSTENVATFRVRNPSLGETNILFVTSSGRVAVNGSLPTARFQVGGVVSGDYIFRAVTNTGTTLLAVTGSRIGVGTENPEESFHVSAASKFTQNVSVTASLVVSGANGAGIFSQGATLVDYLGGITNSASYMVWRAPFSCSVVALYGYYVGGTSPQVNAFRSGSSGIGRLTGSNLTLTAQNVWSASITTGLANTDFNVGDSLQVVISGSSNNQVAVQVDFIRKF